MGVGPPLREGGAGVDEGGVRAGAPAPGETDPGPAGGTPRGGSPHSGRGCEEKHPQRQVPGAVHLSTVRFTSQPCGSSRSFVSLLMH